MFKWLGKLLAILIVLALLVVTGLFWIGLILLLIYGVIEISYKVYKSIKGNRDDGKR